MTKSLTGADDKRKASIYYGLSQIEEFEKTPDKFQPEPALEMPPGAPIGLGGLDFEVIKNY